MGICLSETVCVYVNLAQLIIHKYSEHSWGQNVNTARDQRFSFLYHVSYFVF